MRAASCAWGSSPLSRGAQGDPGPQGERGGIIPARAGSTQPGQRS